jgi:hypothetical protein
VRGVTLTRSTLAATFSRLYSAPRGLFLPPQANMPPELEPVEWTATAKPASVSQCMAVIEPKGGQVGGKRRMKTTTSAISLVH